MEAVDTPDVRDVDDRGRAAAHLHRVVRHGAGVRSGRSARRSRFTRAVERDRRRGGADWRCSGCAIAAARFEPVEGRGVDHGDTVVARSRAARRRRRRPTRTTTSASSSARRRTRRASTSSCSASRSGATKASRIHYPADYPIGELANTDVSYTVTVKGLKRRVLPELDDEFAKDLGEFETLDALTHARARGSRARSEARRRARGSRRADEAAGDARCRSRCRRRWSSARSIGASRTSRGG